MTKTLNNRYYSKFPITINWNITKRCNLRCKHCFNSEFNQEPDLQTIRQYIDYFDLKKVASIALTGGEPFVRDDIFEIIDMINKKNINMSIASNGTLITETHAKHLRNANVRYVQISLDSYCESNNDEIRGCGAFLKTLSGITLLVNNNIKTIIGCVISKKNFRDIGKIAKLAASLNVNALRFELFVPLGLGKDSGLELRYNELIEVNESIKNICIDGIKIINPFNEISNGCDTGYINVVLNEDMSLSPCDLLAETMRTRTADSAADLENIWNNDEIFRKWRNIAVADEYCTSCHLFNDCAFGCRASALAYAGSLYAYDNICLKNKTIV